MDPRFKAEGQGGYSKAIILKKKQTSPKCSV